MLSGMLQRARNEVSRTSSKRRFVGGDTGESGVVDGVKSVGKYSSSVVTVIIVGWPAVSSLFEPITNT